MAIPAKYSLMLKQNKKYLIPEIRAELKKLYDGPDEGFEDFLTEHFFDLHYQAKPTATPGQLRLRPLMAIGHRSS
jgi:hypothetical protein